MTQQAPQPSHETTFEQFWRSYPRRTHKADARKAWGKLKPDADMVQQILIAIAWQRETPQWTKDDGQFIPYPASWIRGECWLDEPVDTKRTPTEHWRDECSRLHNGACHNATWHQVLKERSA